jgi:hypothetical protein
MFLNIKLISFAATVLLDPSCIASADLNSLKNNRTRDMDIHTTYIKNDNFEIQFNINILVKIVSFLTLQEYSLVSRFTER